MSIRDTWQGKVLCTARQRMAAVIPSILAHTESELMLMNLMVACDPPCWDMSRMSLRTPFLCSIAKINKHGQIVADVIERDVLFGPMRRKDFVLFSSVTDFRDELRRGADFCKLTGQERIQFFSAATKWLAADTRLDPTLARDDPDARRMTSPDVKPAYPVH